MLNKKYMYRLPFKLTVAEKHQTALQLQEAEDRLHDLGWRSYHFYKSVRSRSLYSR